MRSISSRVLEASKRRRFDDSTDFLALVPTRSNVWVDSSYRSLVWDARAGHRARRTEGAHLEADEVAPPKLVPRELAISIA